MTSLVDRLRDNSTLAICPFDRRSPEYWSTPNDKPCKFCGSEPDGPDKCTGADTRVMAEAADRIEELEREIALLRNADRPEFDSTDGAHPAWWRGCDHGYAKGLERCARIAEREYKRHCTGSGFDSQPARSTAYSILETIRALADSSQDANNGTDRRDFINGKLNEIVSTKGAHLEYMGESQWFLSFQHEDGTETAIWFTSRNLRNPFWEIRPAVSLSDSSPTLFQEQKDNDGKEEG